MANKNEIRIESILGGISSYDNFSAEDQFSFSCGIDPDLYQLGHDYSLGAHPIKASGYLCARAAWIHATTSALPMWLVTTPKNNEVYVYDAGGTIYSTTVNDNYAKEITTLASSLGNGSAYYDNYVYFSTDSTVARFGPLNQDSPTINTDYWGNSLGKTGLSGTVYPYFDSANTISYPNHILHRHSNGKLYFADVVGNQGVLHCISTKKTTVEGDTDDGSTYNAIDFPPGMWPTAISSYGSDLAVALYEGNTTQNTKQKARVAFWDTTNPDNYYQITSTEFPDSFISAMINSNGVLYVFSGPTLNYFIENSEETDLSQIYTRVSRFVGGYTFEQVAMLEGSIPPTQAGADGILNKIIFSGYVDNFNHFTSAGSAVYGNTGGIFSIGSKLSGISRVLNNIVAIPSVPYTRVGAVKMITDGLDTNGIMFGGVYYDGTENRYVIKDTIGSSLVLDDCLASWRSQLFRVGKPFKVTKVILNMPYGDNFHVNVSVLCDDLYLKYNKDIFGCGMSGNDSHIPLRFENAFGTYNFCISLSWNIGGEYIPFNDSVALPIIIEYELLDD